MLIEHIDKDNIYNNKPLAYSRKNLGKEYLTFHYKKIFNQN